MLTRALLQARTQVTLHLRRNFGVTAVACQKASPALDPIQELFVGKVREYAQKSKSAGGKMVGASNETEKALSDQLARLDSIYQAKGVDMTAFPAFSFSDPALDQVGVNIDLKSAEVEQTQTLEEEEAREEDKAYYDI